MTEEQEIMWKKLSTVAKPVQHYGNRNVAIGYTAGFTTGYMNVAIGNKALANDKR